MEEEVMNVYLYPDCQIGAILTALFCITCTCYLWACTIPALMHTYAVSVNNRCLQHRTHPPPLQVAGIVTLRRRLVVFSLSGEWLLH